MTKLEEIKAHVERTARGLHTVVALCESAAERSYSYEYFSDILDIYERALYEASLLTRDNADTIERELLRVRNLAPARM